MANIIRTHQRKIIGAAVGIATLQVVADSSNMEAFLSYFNPFHTPGVAGIERRYTTGGGAPNAQTATATTRGKQDQVHGNQENHTGAGTPAWEEKIGGQRPDPGAFKKTWNKTHLGNEKGK